MIRIEIDTRGEYGCCRNKKMKIGGIGFRIGLKIFKEIISDI